MGHRQHEVQRENMFKDSILSSAEAKSMDIITQAERKRQEDLSAAQASCEVADYKTIAGHITRNFDRDLSAAMQQARRNLLAFRAQEVENMFGEVVAKLQAFTQSDAYMPWLQKRLRDYGALAERQTLTVHLRPADMHLEEQVHIAIPCQIQQDDSIKLGGAKISDGRRLFDETLDADLATEQEKFYTNSSLAL